MCDNVVAIRGATSSDLPSIAEIHVSSFQNAYTGIMPKAFLDSLSVHGSLRGWQSTFSDYPQNISVAVTAGGHCIGFCCAGPVVDSIRNQPFEFEIYGLHVMPGFRQKGLGRKLFHSAFQRARIELNLKSAIVWTLRDLVRSRQFYEREGGEIVKDDIWRPHDLALPEVAYGWHSLDRFAFDPGPLVGD